MEAVALEHEITRMHAAVVDHHPVRIGNPAGTYVERARTAGEGVRRLSGIAMIVDGGFDAGRNGFRFGELDHGGLLEAEKTCVAFLVG